MIASLLQKTAWPMTPPSPYSLFHILFALTGIFLGALLAWNIRKKSDSVRFRILFLCGVLLAASELYKQFFLYYIVNSSHYDWWYFPFQLCSIPMYLCLLLPFVRHRRMEGIFYTFMQDFGLLGGVMALLEPSGLLHPYWTLTVHGLSWHVILIFISLVILFGRSGSTSPADYAKTLPLLGLFAVIATVINLLTKGTADMFYISPYYPVTQIVFHKISILFGIGPGIVIYLLSICAGGFLCHLAAGKVQNYRGNQL